MRLWHKNLISVLPRQQLLGQWRECCLIAKNISEKGFPNHLLVNKIMDYPLNHFWRYGLMMYDEMVKRGYKPSFVKFSSYFSTEEILGASKLSSIFSDWHTYRYLTQCFYNLQEKYDCGGISKEDFEKINKFYFGLI